MTQTVRKHHFITKNGETGENTPFARMYLGNH